MPDLLWNKKVWDGPSYDWSHAGEKWSKGWGGSEAQWFGSLYPRLHRILPARRILEVAPGYGRWTQFLAQACEELIGIDLSGLCVAACEKRFAHLPHVKFFQNDGLSLAAARGRFDLIFSFDSLVHAELPILKAYVPQMMGLLEIGGVAFIHHSNVPATRPQPIPHTRTAGVQAADVASLVRSAGGSVVHQEILNWGTDSSDLIDCLTLFGRKEDYSDMQRGPVENGEFMDEARIVREYMSPYCKIEPKRAEAAA
jgi:SAM-dependent methyltransferase